jgi:hypothetical protein
MSLTRESANVLSVLNAFALFDMVFLLDVVVFAKG